jgi:hypothetical protein
MARQARKNKNLVENLKEINMTNECGMELIILGDINIDYKDGCTNSKWSNKILDQSIFRIIHTG